MHDLKDSRVVIRNTSLKVTLKCKSVSKNLESGFYVSLTLSHDFLSMIFGIFENFWIDLCVRKNPGIFFEVKKIRKK